MSPSSWAALPQFDLPLLWQWPPWLPTGMLAILAGQSGSGKSALALRLAACYLRGDPWPDGSPFTLQPGAVLWCEAEYSQAINLQRARAWGLPVERIFTPLEDPLVQFDLNSTTHLEALIDRLLLPELRLVIVDSLRGISGRPETSSKTVAVIRTLAELALQFNLPFLLIHHLRKPTSADSSAVVHYDRLRGSSVIAQVARIVWAIDSPNPLQPAARCLQVIKSNLSLFPPPLGFTITFSGLQFMPAPQIPLEPAPLDQALTLLRALLTPGPHRR